MRCRKCSIRAQVEMRRHNTAYCATHYVEFFDNQVKRNLKSRRMFNADDRILVAVSGGKDSLALWDVLHRIGYNVTGLYIDLGIGGYSERSKQRAIAFADSLGAKLIIKDVRQDYGQNITGITELATILRRPACSGCGLTKRYVSNEMAHALGFNVLATGHNLDDEVATLMGNTLHWQMEFLARQSPVLQSTHSKLVKKVKPLYTLTERETLSYVLIRKIDYIEEECPNAKGARSILYKEMLNQIEHASPGTKSAFMKGFLDRARPIIKEDIPLNLTECVRCGEPTTGTVCSFCRIWERAANQEVQPQSN